MQTHDPSTAARMQVPSGRLPGLVVLTRDGSANAESQYEKPMILPAQDELSPSLHAWADARFAVDILAEHALFFMLLMPEELAAPERAEAERFRRTYLELFERLELEGPPPPNELKAFAKRVLESFKPFIDYKARLQDAQSSGRLRSLVWPLFFEHTRHEAERWIRRLETLAGGESEFDKQEVSIFWTNIMDEHARFVAHLLDPDEFELIDKCMKTSRVFCHLHDGGVGGVVGALVDEPGVVTKSLVENPETSAVLSAAQTILDFKTQAARDIEGGRIKSIIDPRLADHVRREALKFVDELRRVT